MTVSSYFMGGLYERTDLATESGGVITINSTSNKKYYSISGMTVAMNDGSGLKYLLTDHLGSVVAVTDSTGTLTSQQRYLPFGQVRSVTSPSPIGTTDFGFTGQRNMDAQGNATLGLMDYHARMYDDYLNQFTQPDSIIPQQYDPQSWNRYEYAEDNPVRYSDPTGHLPSYCYQWDYVCPNGPDEGLTIEGIQARHNLINLGLWGNSDDAMKYVAATEFGPGNIDNPENLNQLQDAMTHRYNQYCGSGAWSSGCVNSFWGYMQGILNPDGKGLANYQAVMNEHPSSVSTVAQTILSSPGAGGCTKSDGSEQVCGWATITSGPLLTCLSSNPNCWPQNPGVQQYEFGNTAYITPLKSGAEFIVLSANEQAALCINWGLDPSCSLLQIQ